MLWFEGSIPEAIASAKQRSLVFVVVIAGEDEQSKHLMSSWEDVGVSEAAQNCCVAIKVDASSDTCVQFSQIYPVVCVPSSFFIGVTGIPLEVIAGSVSPQELMNRINKVKKMHSEGIGNTASSGVQDSLQSRTDNKDKESVSVPQMSAGLETVHSEPGAAAATTKESLSCSAEEDESPSAENSSSSHASCSGNENLDAKVERLTKKLGERQEQRNQEQKENDVRKESERRKMGKHNQEFKRKQDLENTKKLLEERNREKAEEKAARDRVRQQIAMDRAERAASYAKMRQDEQNLLEAKQAEQEARKEMLIRERSTISRIQFRLPDGSSFTNQFPSQARLQEAWSFAHEEIGNVYGNFSLATTYPRREFTNDDLNKSLQELEMVPSASVVVLPSRRLANAVIRSSGFSLWTALGNIFYPLLAFWRMLSSFLFAAPHSASAFRGQAEQSPPPSSSPSSANQAKRETPSKQNLEMQQKDFKKEGKICRLRTEEDEDEENNTWNGNSTQQM